MPQHDRIIIIKGARHTYLKNIDLEIPRDQLVVISGLSSSGLIETTTTPETRPSAFAEGNNTSA